MNFSVASGHDPAIKRGASICRFGSDSLLDSEPAPYPRGMRVFGLVPTVLRGNAVFDALRRVFLSGQLWGLCRFSPGNDR